MDIGSMEWGVQLWIDLWVAGMAGGAFMTAFVAHRYSGGRFKNLFKLSVLTGFVLALVGVGLLLSHLGHLQWFWHMFVNIRPESVLSLGGWILTGWLTVAGIMIFLWIVSHYAKGWQSFSDKATGFLSWFGLAFSVLLMTYTGVLISASSQPFWSETPMLPAIFVISAICSGVAWLLVASLLVNWLNGTGSGAWSWIISQFFDSSDWEVDSTAITSLARSLAVVIGLEIAALAGFMIWLWATGSTEAVNALQLLTGGSLSIWFWAGLVGAGLALPLVLVAFNWNKDFSRGTMATITASSGGLVVLGGLLVRALLLIAGQA